LLEEKISHLEKLMPDVVLRMSGVRSIRKSFEDCRTKL